MQDNDLFALLIAQVNAGLTAANMPATVKQRYQPTTQGTPAGPAVFVFKVSDRRYGSPGVTDVYDDTTDPANPVNIHTETQMIETTLQFSAEVTQDPTDMTLPTSSDMLHMVAAIVQSEPFIQTMRAAGVGVQRVTEVRNPYFKDDRDRYQADPSFDFTVSHEKAMIKTSPAAETVNFNIYRV